MKSQTQSQSKHLRRTVEMCVFVMLGTLMFISKIVMEFLPNIHLVGVLTIVYTVVFRKKALIPIYVAVMLMGLYGGFSYWWIPYLYIWTLLWALAMLIPRKTPTVLLAVIYPVLCALHGFAFGALYAPAQALMFGFDFDQTLAWIAAGLPFDVIHGIGNFVAGLLILPLSRLLQRLDRQINV